MPRFIVRLAEDKYVMWSTVVDAPVTHVMTREQATDYMRNIYTADVADRVRAELRLADNHGCGAMKWDITDIVDHNRAGVGETHLHTVEEIIEAYSPDKNSRMENE